MTDLLRRLAARGIRVTKFDDGYWLAGNGKLGAYFFDDPVAEAVVHHLAKTFALALVELYFDRTERDLN